MAKRLAKSSATDYAALLADIKSRIRSAQVKAALAVNSELISLYWNIGRAIVQRQKDERWGRSVVERLAGDLHAEFPDMSGFSERNIWLMRSFFLAWNEIPSILQQAVAESPPQPVSGMPWGHNIVLLEKLKDPAVRLGYAHQIIANGWSRAILVHWIESGLHKRQGSAVTNFKSALPAPPSDLAQQLINFDFLTLAPDAAERDLELALVDQITRFLIELGAGFAFVGRQVPIEVDDQMRKENDAPSIGSPGTCRRESTEETPGQGFLKQGGVTMGRVPMFHGARQVLALCGNRLKRT